MHQLKCPNTHIEKEKRIEELFESIEGWIDSLEMYNLVHLFGGDENGIFSHHSLKTTLSDLNNFVNQVWDYRKTQQERGAERWLLNDDTFMKKHQDEIIKNVKQLGMIDNYKTDMEPDYILPLGGARMQNLYRVQMAKKVIDQQNLSNRKIVGLTGKRPLGEIEFPCTETYAPGAIDESTTMMMGFKKTFDLSGTYVEIGVLSDTMNQSSMMASFQDTYKENELYVLTAPSENSERRANSHDTLVYFFEQFEVPEHSKILLTTTSVYVPYQTIAVMDLAIEHNVQISVIGTDPTISGQGLSKTINYIQELKGAVNEATKLAEKYL